MDDQGQVVGEASTSGGGYATAAFRYTDREGLVNLGTLGGSGVGQRSRDQPLRVPDRRARSHGKRFLAPLPLRHECQADDGSRSGDCQSPRQSAGWVIGPPRSTTPAKSAATSEPVRILWPTC